MSVSQNPWLWCMPSLHVQALSDPDTTWQPWFAEAALRLAQALAACCCLQPPLPPSPSEACPEDDAVQKGQPGPLSEATTHHQLPSTMANGGVLVPPDSNPLLPPTTTAAAVDGDGGRHENEMEGLWDAKRRRLTHAPLPTPGAHSTPGPLFCCCCREVLQLCVEGLCAHAMLRLNSVTCSAYIMGLALVYCLSQHRQARLHCDGALELLLVVTTQLFMFLTIMPPFPCLHPQTCTPHRPLS